MKHAEIAANARAPYARKIMELEAVITQLTAERAGKFAPPPDPTMPTVHLNGTSKKELLEGYEAAAYAIATAQDAMNNITVNARDYYVQGPDAFTAARNEFEEAAKQLEAARLYCYARMEYLCDLD